MVKCNGILDQKISLLPGTPNKSRKISPITVCMNKVVAGEVDLCALPYAFANRRAEKVHFVTPHLFSQAKANAIVELSDGFDRVGSGWGYWLKFATAFSKEVWMALAVTIVGVIGMFYLVSVLVLRKNFLSRIIDRVWRILLYQDKGSFPGYVESTFGSRLILLIWAIAVLIIAETFSGSIMVATSIQPGYTPPFRNLVEMREQGYYFSQSRYGLYGQMLIKLLKELETAGSPDYPYLKEALSHQNSWMDAQLLYNYGSLVPSLIKQREEGHKFLYTRAEFVFNDCFFRAIPLTIRVSANTTLNWPDSFLGQRASFITSLHNHTLNIKLDRAALEFASTGLDLLTERRRALHNPIERIYNMSPYKYCQHKRRPRLQIRPFAQTGARFEEELSIFVFVSALLLVCIGVFVLELVYARIRRFRKLIGAKKPSFRYNVALLDQYQLLDFDKILSGQRCSVVVALEDSEIVFRVVE